MTQKNRIDGGLIDRNIPLNFTFDGKKYSGFHGDTLASALLANGINLVGRSFKYHRPRGIFTSDSSEPNALVELINEDTKEPNSRSTTIQLFDGLTAQSQNCWPSLKYDIQSINDCFAPLLSPLELHLLISISTKMKMVPETGDNNPSFLMMKSTTS